MPTKNLVLLADLAGEIVSLTIRQTVISMFIVNHCFVLRKSYIDCPSLHLYSPVIQIGLSKIFLHCKLPDDLKINGLQELLPK